MAGSLLCDKLIPGSEGRQDEAEEDDSGINSESKYISSAVDADDEDEGTEEQQEIWQAIPSELIPDQASRRRKRKALHSKAPAKRYNRTQHAGI